MTAVEFDVEPGPLPALEWGDYPEFLPAAGGARARIRLGRYGPDWWRVRYQVAHELFHWACTPAGVFHWAHELFAVEMAVRAMARIGEHAYAARCAAELAADAERLDLAGMLRARLELAYPEGLYGRAFLTGRALAEAVGWERLKPLATSFDRRGRPDVAAWARSFPSEERERIEAVLGPPAGWA